MLSNIKYFFVCFVLALLFYSTVHAYKTDTIIGKNEVSSKVKSEKIVKTQRLKDNILEKVPVAGKIIKEEIDDKTNAVIWTLSNGAAVVLKKIDNKIDKIAMTALANGGILNVPKKEIISTKLVGVF
jgi:zinc protease